MTIDPVMILGMPQQKVFPDGDCFVVENNGPVPLMLRDRVVLTLTCEVVETEPGKVKLRVVDESVYAADES